MLIVYRLACLEQTRLPFFKTHIAIYKNCGENSKNYFVGALLFPVLQGTKLIYVSAGKFLIFRIPVGHDLSGPVRFGKKILLIA